MRNIEVQNNRIHKYHREVRRGVQGRILGARIKWVLGKMPPNRIILIKTLAGCPVVRAEEFGLFDEVSSVHE